MNNASKSHFVLCKNALEVTSLILLQSTLFSLKQHTINFDFMLKVVKVQTNSLNFCIKLLKL